MNTQRRNMNTLSAAILLSFWRIHLPHWICDFFIHLQGNCINIFSLQLLCSCRLPVEWKCGFVVWEEPRYQLKIQYIKHVTKLLLCVHNQTSDLYLKASIKSPLLLSALAACYFILCICKRRSLSSQFPATHQFLKKSTRVCWTGRYEQLVSVC